jgi:hypothetical protein
VGGTPPAVGSRQIKTTKPPAQRNRISADFVGTKETAPMSRTHRPNLEFVQSFVDALTVRPFLNDLRRTRRTPQMLLSLPRIDDEELARDTANAA